MPIIGNKSNVPSHLHMMHHVYRSKFHEVNTKSIINTDTALTLRQHKHDICLKGRTCLKIIVDPNLAQLHHYRKECSTEIYGDVKCDKMGKTIVKDTRIHLHLENVIKNSNIALKNINFD